MAMDKNFADNCVTHLNERLIIMWVFLLRCEPPNYSWQGLGRSCPSAYCLSKQKNVIHNL